MADPDGTERGGLGQGGLRILDVEDFTGGDPVVRGGCRGGGRGEASKVGARIETFRDI
ncbi:hypothetical protein [Streptomyces macrosporus]|uniref:hypothetical protein n=1 Tax=Streptomyces macrosporus TaxID=44032 RepID=UPI0031E2D7EA